MKFVTVQISEEGSLKLSAEGVGPKEMIAAAGAILAAVESRWHCNIGDVIAEAIRGIFKLKPGVPEITTTTV